VSGLTLTPTLDQAGAWSLTALPRWGLGERVGLEGVLGDLRLRGRRGRRLVGRRVGRRGPGDARGFRWNRHDTSTHEWWPQGITTSSDSGAPLLAGESRVLLASWYRRDGADPDTAARVSVVDLGPAGRAADRPAYEHVLLVEAVRDPVSRAARHRQVRAHAGGLAWWGDLLLVADTRTGLRIFDLRDIVRQEPHSPDTHGCRYLLPQCGRWTAAAGEGVQPLRWSFCSLDRTAIEGDSLVAGEYSKGMGARLARFPLPEGDPTTLESAEIVTTDIPSMQGACRVRGTYVVSASNGAHHRGHLWMGGPDGFRQHARVLPVGPEDLSLDRRTGRLWTLTEYPGRRVVVSLPLPRG